MKKIGALIARMTANIAALYAQTEAEACFKTKAAENGSGVVITKYTGSGGNVAIPAAYQGNVTPFRGFTQRNPAALRFFSHRSRIHLFSFY